MARKSTSDVFITANGIPLIWRSKRQSGVALCSCETEYISTSESVKYIIWLRCVLVILSLLEPRPTLLLVNNMEEIRLSKSEKIAKHTDNRYHFLQDAAQKKSVIVGLLQSENMVADLMTKIALNTLWTSLVFYQFEVGMYSKVKEAIFELILLSRV